jgi:hypothetical protein
MSTLWKGVGAPVRQNLVRKYRPIGPAAIAAAVYAMKKRKPARHAGIHNATNSAAVHTLRGGI